MADTPRELRVGSGEVTLAVREHSPAEPGRPTVVLVHGYPDRQDTWDALVAELPLDTLHVVTYDVRGAGASTAPAEESGYLTERLVEDLAAVVEAVRPDGGPVHLVGHDWGSVQLWDAVAAAPHHDRLRGRIASFTSISGPSLDHVAWLSRHREGRERALLRQGRHSWYIGFFRLPLVPEQVWGRLHPVLGRAIERAERLPRGHFGPGLGRDAVNGLSLYRANVTGRMRRPGRLQTDVPVQVLHPRYDRFLTPVLLEDLDRACSDLTVETLDAGHWAIVTHADVVAAKVRDHVLAHAG